MAGLLGFWTLHWSNGHEIVGADVSPSTWRHAIPALGSLLQPSDRRSTVRFSLSWLGVHSMLLMRYCTNVMDHNLRYYKNIMDHNLRTPLDSQAELQSLMNTLAGQQLQQNILDKRSTVTGSMDITTSTNYNLLTYHGILWQPASIIWNKATPNTCRIFLWLAFRDRLNTNANRVHKKWAIDPHCSSCPTIETANHIILHCKLADEVWKKLNLHMQAMSSANIQAFVELILDNMPEQQKLGWPACFAACAHGLWKARNQRAEVSEDKSKAYNVADLGEFLYKEDRCNVTNVKEVVLSVIENTPVLHLIDPKRIKFLAENLAGKESEDELDEGT
uniref:Reverse transcriptase zinc-binding domain-containing protein n=1 Tax=Oryza sativa subsp. japonica TaxID=39947 RepID=Q75LK1_ORYSJ|nr:hypothetical protein [Oryza sativa Japonica Group]